MEIPLIKTACVCSACNDIKMIWIDTELSFTAVIYDKSVYTTTFSFDDKAMCRNCPTFCNLKRPVAVDSSSSKKEPATTVWLWNDKLPESRRQTGIIKGHELLLSSD